MSQLIGSIVNKRYLIESVLGIGGMSVVFRAHDQAEDREVSLKVLKADQMGDAEACRRFFNESRAIALLSHPNIVQVYDVNFEGNLRYIAMEYVDGVMLKDRMDQKGKLSLSETTHYLRQLLSALDHAHSRGVVHHDIKPQNILLLPDATVKVTDFGIATMNNAQDVVSDDAVGSVHYISPEQAQGQMSDEKSDLYSVGVMTYAMLTGHLPFDAPRAVDVARMQVKSAPYPMEELVPDLPVGIRQIVYKSMAKRPEDRYQSAMEMLRDVVQLEEDPETVFDYPSVYRLPESASHRAGQETEKKKFLTPLKRNRLLAWIGGGLLAAVILTVGVFVMLGIVNNLYQEYVNVPSYTGLTLEDIQSSAEISQKFKFNVTYEHSNLVEKDIIISQTPLAGEQAFAGSQIELVISSGASYTSVPSLIGKTEEQAIAALKTAGLTYTVKTQVGSLSTPEGQVLSCDPAAGTELMEGSPVIIYVNARAIITEAIMPNVVGMSKESAITALYKKGITNVTVKDVVDPTLEEGIVLSQSVAEDGIVSLNDTVTITVSRAVEAKPEEEPIDEPEA